MDIVRLGTPTGKSILGFGQHADMSVGQVLALNKTTYLRWIYYHCSMISFNDEILNKIWIKPGERIEKPGNDPEMFKKVDARCKEHLSWPVKQHMKFRIKCRAKPRRKSFVFLSCNRTKVQTTS